MRTPNTVLHAHPHGTPDGSDVGFRRELLQETAGMEPGDMSVDGLGTTYGTGELAPVSGEYQLVGHEIPVNARCRVLRRVGGMLVEGYAGSASDAAITVLKHTPLPSHGPCGQGALWCLTWAGGGRYMPQRDVASRRTVAAADAARRQSGARSVQQL